MSQEREVDDEEVEVNIKWRPIYWYLYHELRRDRVFSSVMGCWVAWQR
jgi:hypothetical protein